MKQTLAYIALGSNLGDSHAHLDAAVEALAGSDGIEQVLESPRYVTDPMGPQDQPDYLNSACSCVTHLLPLQLLDVLQAIEIERGRVRPSEAEAIAALRWHARTLDLDLLLFGDEQIKSERLTVPHPGIAHRSFVLKPLWDLNPTLNIPELGSVENLLHRLQ